MTGQQFIKDYFTFTRKERIGIMVILFLILFVILVPKFVSKHRHVQYSTADTSWMAAAKRLEIKESQANGQKKSKQNNDNSVDQYKRSVNSSNTASSSLFYFDPNTLDVDGWKKLGLKDKTVHTIQNYLSKGGHFYKPEDLKKVYGLHPNDYSRLEPYVKIENSKANSDNNPVEYTKKEVEIKHPSLSVIDINAADTAAFISLPGIGGKLAARIVNFRDRLGGFYSIDQISETYGLADSVFQKIKQYLTLRNVSVKKININKATVDDLKAHPYIRYAIASSIVSYRNEHGPFSRIEEIKKVMAITDEVYKKVEPYVSLE